jgi:hypothetical protein
VFNSLTIGTGELDVGSVAEAMVYYGSVDLYLKGGSLVDLVEHFGYDALVTAIDNKFLQIIFERYHYAVMSNGERPTFHDFGNVNLAGSAKGEKIQNAADEIEHQFLRRFGRNAENRTRARNLADKVRVADSNEQILQVARSDAKDKKFVTAAIKALLKALMPGYELPINFRFEVATAKEGFVVLTNLDWTEINRLYHKRVSPTHSSITPAYLLVHLLDARKELTLSANSETDLLVGDGVSAILQTRISSIASRVTKASQDIKYFHVTEFEGRTFREAINNKERTGVELINLLEDTDTQKFKTWLKSQNPDGFLMKEYDKAVVGRHGWTARLPFRAGKIVTFTGLGLAADALLGTFGLATAAATAASAATELGLGATDEFMLEKLLRGWKPDQFIEGPAKEFLEGTRTAKS